MALPEQLWPAVSQAFTADGDVTGVVTVASTDGFYSGQLVQIRSAALPALNAQVLEVLSSLTLRVGAVGQQYLGSGISLAGYITGDTATISAARQLKVLPGNDDIFTAVYENQPTSALRVMTVDRQGNYISPAGGGAAGAGSVSVTNTVSITSAFSSAAWQFIKVPSTSVTAGNASITQAFVAGTLSGNAKILNGINSLNQNIGVSLNGAQILELGSAESFSFDLGATSRQVNSSTTIGVWNVSATSTSGSLRLTLVS